MLTERIPRSEIRAPITNQESPILIRIFARLAALPINHLGPIIFRRGRQKRLEDAPCKRHRRRNQIS
jgi:hypothetical protein